MTKGHNGHDKERAHGRDLRRLPMPRKDVRTLDRIKSPAPLIQAGFPVFGPDHTEVL